MVCWSFFFHHADTLKRVLRTRKVKLKKLELGMTERLQNNGWNVMYHDNSTRLIRLTSSDWFIDYSATCEQASENNGCANPGLTWGSGLQFYRNRTAYLYWATLPIFRGGPLLWKFTPREKHTLLPSPMYTKLPLFENGDWYYWYHTWYIHANFCKWWEDMVAPMKNEFWKLAP